MRKEEHHAVPAAKPLPSSVGNDGAVHTKQLQSEWTKPGVAMRGAPGVGRQVIARMFGRCACCGCPIRPGDRIEKGPYGWVQVDCPGDTDEMGEWEP